MALHRDIFWVGRQWAVTGYGIQACNQKQKASSTSRAPGCGMTACSKGCAPNPGSMSRISRRALEGRAQALPRAVANGRRAEAGWPGFEAPGLEARRVEISDVEAPDIEFPDIEFAGFQAGAQDGTSRRRALGGGSEIRTARKLPCEIRQHLAHPPSGLSARTAVGRRHSGVPGLPRRRERDKTAAPESIERGNWSDAN